MKFLNKIEEKVDAELYMKYMKVGLKELKDNLLSRINEIDKCFVNKLQQEKDKNEKIISR